MSTMKTLRVLLRRTMAIALLSVPMEVIPGEDRRIALAIDNYPERDTHEALMDELEKLEINATFTDASTPNLNHDNARQFLEGTTKILRQLNSRAPLSFTPSATQTCITNDSSPTIPDDRLTLLDIEQDNPQEIADFVAENAFPGAVILLRPEYSQRDQVLQVLPMISKRLRAEGYTFASLSDLCTEST